MVYGRLKKSYVWHEHSHESDWIFLILLLYVVATGVLQHVLHRTGSGLSANIAYMAHMMGVIPMFLVEVPISKWSHMMYRPLAMFFANLVAIGLRKKARKPSALSSPQLAPIS